MAGGKKAAAAAAPSPRRTPSQRYSVFLTTEAQRPENERKNVRAYERQTLHAQRPTSCLCVSVVQIHGLMRRVIVFGVLLLAGCFCKGGENFLALPVPGQTILRILSPTLLELTLVERKEPDPAPLRQWISSIKDLISIPPRCRICGQGGVAGDHGAGGWVPPAGAYAPLKKRDLRVGSFLYLQLTAPVAEGEKVEVLTRATISGRRSKNSWPRPCRGDGARCCTSTRRVTSLPFQTRHGRLLPRQPGRNGTSRRRSAFI